MDVEAEARTSASGYRVAMASARSNTGRRGLGWMSGANGGCAVRLDGSPIAESRALLTA